MDAERNAPGKNAIDQRLRDLEAELQLDGDIEPKETKSVEPEAGEPKETKSPGPEAGEPKETKSAELEAGEPKETKSPGPEAPTEKKRRKNRRDRKAEKNAAEAAASPLAGATPAAPPVGSAAPDPAAAVAPPVAPPGAPVAPPPAPLPAPAAVLAPINPVSHPTNHLAAVSNLIRTGQARLDQGTPTVLPSRGGAPPTIEIRCSLLDALTGATVPNSGFVAHYHPDAKGPSVGHASASTAHLKADSRGAIPRVDWDQAPPQILGLLPKPKDIRSGYNRGEYK